MKTATRLAAMAALFLTCAAVPAAPAYADLTSDTVALTGAELRLVADNPALLRMGEQRPALLRQALDLIHAHAPATKNAIGGGTAGTPPALPAEDQKLVDENPAIDDLLRTSPEAALDLLRLIKEAAQQK